MGLSGGRGNVLEVSAVVQHDRVVELRDCGRQKTNDARGAMMTARGHPQLNVARSFRDRLADRQVHVPLTRQLSPLAPRSG